MDNLNPELIKNLAILIWVIVFIQLFNIFRNRFLENKRTTYNLNSHSFEAKKYFFSYSELELYKLLSGFLSWQYDIFPKVRLLDLADTKYKINFSKIAQKHVDFLIVDKKNHCTPILAIELNGNSHNTKKMETRDEFVWEFFDIIKIPLLTIWNDELKNSDEVVEKIKKQIS